MSESDLELRNPLVLATIATASLGASLIAYQNIGTMAAWAVGAPAAVAFARMLSYTIQATASIGKTAYRDVSRPFKPARIAWR